MRIIIAAGGTGGHIYPGIAIAKEILRRNSESKILFVGTARGLETKIVPDSGFELSLINSVGLKSVGIAEKLKGLAILPKSFIEARKIIREFMPEVVVGAGGYVTGSVILMASVMRIPTLVMDSNALPGFTNRRLAPFVTKAALTFEEALPFFGKKGIVTGNPVRKEFFDIKPKSRGETINLLIFGGSQGARAINNTMTEALPLLNSVKNKLSITHQTGVFDFQKIAEIYEREGWNEADVRAYFSDMVSAFEKADLMLCRAGATTCAELSAAGKAAILIPLPTAADDHQRKNAEALEKVGAAKMIAQSDLSKETLAKEIMDLINFPDKITEMEKAAKRLAKADAAESTVDLIEEMAKK